LSKSIAHSILNYDTIWRARLQWIYASILVVVSETLEATVRCPFFAADGRKLFGEFLRGEFSEENLEFWLACEQYRACDDADQLAGMAQQIYQDFVAPNAPREVTFWTSDAAK